MTVFLQPNPVRREILHEFVRIALHGARGSHCCGKWGAARWESAFMDYCCPGLGRKTEMEACIKLYYIKIENKTLKTICTSTEI